MKRTCREDERPGLQALLRGAAEAHALLPDGSPYVRSVEVLQAGLIEMLGVDPPAPHPSTPARREEEA